MGATTKTTYITAELEWAEIQLTNWKAYVDANPLHEIKDRIQYKEMKSGRVPMVIATQEAQGKFVQETMKNYLALLEQVDKLREQEVKKLEARGGAVIPTRMKRKG
jgi:hypothetical protein